MSADLIARLGGLTGPVHDCFERGRLARLAPNAVNDLDSENLFNLALIGGLPAIGAAVALVERCLPGCEWTVSSNTRHPDVGPYAEIVVHRPTGKSGYCATNGASAMPAIALLIALFRALAAEGARDGN